MQPLSVQPSLQAKHARAASPRGIRSLLREPLSRDEGPRALQTFRASMGTANLQSIHVGSALQCPLCQDSPALAAPEFQQSCVRSRALGSGTRSSFQVSRRVCSLSSGPVCLQDSPEAGAALATHGSCTPCQELGWEDNVPSLRGGGDARLGGSCFSQTKVFQPNPSARARDLEGAQRCLTIPTATFLLAQGSWEVPGYPLHPPPPLLADIGFAPSWYSTATFQRQLKQPSVHHFLTKFHFFFLHLLSLCLFRVLSLGFQFLLRRLLHK